MARGREVEEFRASFARVRVAVRAREGITARRRREFNNGGVGASDAESRERRAVRFHRRRDVPVSAQMVQQRPERGEKSVRIVARIALAFLLRMSVVRERHGNRVLRLGARVLAERVFRYEREEREEKRRW